MSEWHYEWQNQFPVENQEVVFKRDKLIHRADVFINNTVIEFQHSPIKGEEFYDRNEFYNALGYNVIWIFDVQEKEVEYINDSKAGGGSIFSWKHPIQFLNDFDYKDKNVRVYLQNGRNTWNEDPNYRKIEYIDEIENLEEFNLIGIDWISPDGLKRFVCNEEISDIEFLEKYINFNFKESNFEDHKNYTIHDIADSISINNQNNFYGYCPKDENTLTNHTNCIDCKYLDINSFRCIKRFENLHKKDLELVNDIEYDDEGRVIEYDITINGENILYKNSKIIPSSKKSIIDFVFLNKNMKVARFLNTENGKIYQMSATNMKVLRDEKKCIGKYCGTEYGLKSYCEEKQIYYWNKKIWLLIWYVEF